MPVTHTQQEIIEQSIEHLINIPEDKAALPGYVRSLTSIFLPTMDEKADDLNLLHRCFHKPTEFFSNLEKTNKNITLGEVQEVIVNYISRCIDHSAKTLSVDALSLDWDKRQFLSAVSSSEQYQHKFETITRATIVDEHPYFLAPDHQRFKLHFIPETDPPIITLNLTIDTELGEVKETSVVPLFDILDHVGRPFDPFEARIATRQFADLVLEKASVVAGNVLVNMLAQQEVIDTFLSMECTDSAKALVTYWHYHSAIKNNVIDFAEVAYIEEDELAILSNQSIARLIPDVLSIEKAKSLKKAAFMVLSHAFYSQALVHEKIKLDWLDDVTMKQARRLVSSYVMNLIQLNVLTYFQAIKVLSKDVYSVLSSEFHYASVKQGYFAFRDIRHIGAVRSNLLLNEKIIKLLANKIISYPDVLGLPTKLIKLLVANDLLLHYVEAGIVTLNQLNKIAIIDEMSQSTSDPLTASEIVVAKRFIAEFLQLAEHGLLSLSNISLYHGAIKSAELRGEVSSVGSSLLQIPAMTASCERQVTRRMQAMVDQQPLSFQNNTKDSFEKITTSCESCHFDFKKIRNWFLDNGIHDYLENRVRLFYTMFEARKDLGISDLTLYGHMIGARLYALFENRPYRVSGRVDTVSALQEVIDSYDAKFNPYLTTVSLTAATIQYFLRKVLEHIESIGAIQNQAVAAIYRGIVTEIKKADSASVHALEIESLSPWPKAFSEIVKITSSKLSVAHAAKSPRDDSHKRLKLFGGPYSDSFSSEHQLGRFCERFNGLSSLVSCVERQFALR